MKNKFITFKDFSLLIELSIGQAAMFAGKIHKGQFRKSSGEPYIKHPLAVYKILRKFGIRDRLILITAFLHDCIEDGEKITYNVIKNKFSKEVADLTQEVTSKPKELQKLGKSEYLAQKLIKMSKKALYIKLADRLHNVEDLDQRPKKKAEKYIQQTIYILKEVIDKRSLDKVHKKIIKEIKKYLINFTGPEKYKEIENSITG